MLYRPLQSSMLGPWLVFLASVLVMLLTNRLDTKLEMYKVNEQFTRGKNQAAFSLIIYLSLSSTFSPLLRGDIACCATKLR